MGDRRNQVGKVTGPTFEDCPRFMWFFSLDIRLRRPVCSQGTLLFSGSSENTEAHWGKSLAWGHSSGRWEDRISPSSSSWHSCVHHWYLVPSRLAGWRVRSSQCLLFPTDCVVLIRLCLSVLFFIFLGLVFSLFLYLLFKASPLVPCLSSSIHLHSRTG